MTDTTYMNTTTYPAGPARLAAIAVLAAEVDAAIAAHGVSFPDGKARGSKVVAGEFVGKVAEQDFAACHVHFHRDGVRVSRTLV